MAFFIGEWDRHRRYRNHEKKTTPHSLKGQNEKTRLVLWDLWTLFVFKRVLLTVDFCSICFSIPPSPVLGSRKWGSILSDVCFHLHPWMYTYVCANDQHRTRLGRDDLKRRFTPILLPDSPRPLKAAKTRRRSPHRSRFHIFSLENQQWAWNS